MNKDLFRAACLSYLSLPYKWGGDDPLQGFDCSGLVQELLAILGLDPAGDQTAQALHDHFANRSINVKADVGSLVFYGISTKKITHVGMMIDGGTMIEAGGGGSKTTDLSSAASQNAYVRLRRVDRRSDCVAIITPADLPWLQRSSAS